MKYLMVALGFANGMRCPHVGQYLRSFDHERDNGKGWADFTSNPAIAMRFDTKAEAFEFWNRQSKKQPTRPDGKPNKPLTSLSITLEPIDE